MESLKRSIKYQFIESKKFLLGFWIIILLVDIGIYMMNSLMSDNVNIGMSIGTSEGVTAISVAGINLMAILISLLVYNYERNYENFPLAISLSMTRKNYFLSFLIDNVMIASIFATIQGILLKVESIIAQDVLNTPLYNFEYFNTKIDNVFFIIFTLFILFLAFISFWNLIASINYKLGYKMWIILVGINIVLAVLNIELIGRVVKNIGRIFFQRLGGLQVLAILVSILLCYTLNYFVVSRTDVKTKID